MPSSAPRSAPPLAEQVVRKTRRTLKHGRRWLHNALHGMPADRRVVFIMGAQRSGTRVPLLALERCPDILTFREGAAPFFDGVRLRPPAVLDQQFAHSRFPVLVIKPLCESHRALELLDRFPASRIVWIFRGVDDTVRSASVKWTSGAVAVQQLVEGGLPADDWRRGGLTDETRVIAARLYRPGLGLHHANAIMWYLRNRLLLDLGLFDNDRVLVVKYEDLSKDPARHFPRLFDFVGQPFRAEYTRGIHDRSVGRGPLADVPADVLEACHSLYQQIDARYQQAVTRAGRS